MAPRGDSGLYAADYEHDALQTCAADGSCKQVCPVAIDTGALVKEFRRRERGEREETVALAARIAAHPRAATRASTSLVRAARRDAVVEADRREQAAFGALLGGAVGSGTLAEFAARPAPGP